jgi:hypothetical protein
VIPVKNPSEPPPGILARSKIYGSPFVKIHLDAHIVLLSLSKASDQSASSSRYAVREPTSIPDAIRDILCL